jgi:hypothetical protein
MLPLDASVATRLVAPRPSMAAGRDVFTYSGKPTTGMPIATAPNLLGTSFTMTAVVDVLQAGADGVIATAGGRFGGWALYALKGKPVFNWNLLDLKRMKWMAPEALAPGKHTIEYDFKYDGLGFATLAFNSMSGIARPGTGVLKVDGNVVATQTMEKTIPLIFAIDETFDIGSDTGSSVDTGRPVPPQSTRRGYGASDTPPVAGDAYSANRLGAHIFDDFAEKLTGKYPCAQVPAIAFLWRRLIIPPTAVT